MHKKSGVLFLAILTLLITAESLSQQATPAPQKTITSSWPVVSPDGRWIAFLSDRDGAANLFVVAASGGKATQLTHSKHDVETPSWSADAAELRFVIFDGKTSSIFAVSRDGGNQRTVGQVPGQGAEVSPDGKRVIYNVSGSWTSTKLVTANLDGSNAHQITGGSSIAWNRRWSPDGARIAFTGRDADGKTQIFLMNADGSGLKQLTHDAGTQVPAWSPKGDQLAVQISVEKGKSEIGIVDAATGSIRRVGSHPDRYLDEVPSWFPDSKRLAIQSNRSGSMQIWTINVETGEAKQITP